MTEGKRSEWRRGARPSAPSNTSPRSRGFPDRSAHMDMRGVVKSQRSGRSAVLHDGRPSKVFGGGGYEFGEVWSTESPAPSFGSDVDRTEEFADFSTDIK